jgi:uncharacterized protein YciI
MNFSILIYDEPESAALRDEHRTAHLSYLKAFDADTQFAGPFTTDDESADLGSLRLISFPDRAAAEKHIADEPYVIAGIQKRWQIHRWTPAQSSTWRDCPRKDGNIQALFYGTGQLGKIDERMAHREAEDAYFNENTDSIMMRGHMLSDDGTEQVGSLWLLDVPDLEIGRALLEAAPLYKSGIYKDAMLHRWRFGRVFDRFKL